MQIYGYARYNTLKNLPQHLNIPQQQTLIESYAKEQGLFLNATLVDEEETSVSLGLPGVKELMRLAETGRLDVLIVARLDRLPRAVMPFNRFIQKVCYQHRVRLLSVMDRFDSHSECGKQVLGMAGVFAQWESHKISDRTKELIERKRKLGERVGHAPFGFSYQNRRLVPVDIELQVVRIIHEKRYQERLSYHKIAKFLNNLHVPSKRGGRWHAETVKSISLNPIYKGLT